jgi:DtxR family Mn-dependent transcriptional regulator
MEGMSLTRWPLEMPGRIVHLEDEPPEIFAQLLAEGLKLGDDLRIMERTPEQVRFYTEEREYVVASVVAANITIAALPEKAPVEGPFRRLSELKIGEEGTVKDLSGECRGLTRRRLLDLGFTSGAAIKVERVGPFGDPRVYLVRGTLIALRKEQADHVLMEPAAGSYGSGTDA